MENTKDKNLEINDLTMVEPSQEPNIDLQPLTFQQEFFSHFKPATANTFPTKKTSSRNPKRRIG